MTPLELAHAPRQSSATPHTRHRLERVLVLGSFAYPALLVATLHLTWVAAWVTLGHPPRPNLDDPKFIGLLADILYIATLGMLMCAPGAIVIGLVMIPFAVALRTPERQRGLLLGSVTSLSLVFLWGVALCFLWLDPWDVVTWYAD